MDSSTNSAEKFQSSQTSSAGTNSNVDQSNQHPPAPQNHKEDLWRKAGSIAFWSLIPAIAVIPLWITFAQMLFCGGGWLLFLMVYFILPVLVLYHLVLSVLAFFGPIKFTLTKLSTIILGIYYVMAILLGVSRIDGGDTKESIGSALTFIGVPDSINLVLFYVSSFAVSVLMVGLLIFLIVDIVTARKLKRARTQL